MKNFIHQKTFDFWDLDDDTGLSKIDASHREAALREKILYTLRTLYPRHVDREGLRSTVEARASTFWRILTNLIRNGEVQRIGGGRRGRPYRYLLGREKE